jgi:hypothetical protein
LPSDETEDEAAGLAAAVAPAEKATMVSPLSSVKTGPEADTTEEDTGAMEVVVAPGAMEGDDELAGEAEEKREAEEVDEDIAAADDGGAALQAGSLVLDTTTDDDEECALENPESDDTERGGAELVLG